MYCRGWVPAYFLIWAMVTTLWHPSPAQPCLRSVSPLIPSCCVPGLQLSFEVGSRLLLFPSIKRPCTGRVAPTLVRLRGGVGETDSFQEAVHVAEYVSSLKGEDASQEGGHPSPSPGPVSEQDAQALCVDTTDSGAKVAEGHSGFGILSHEANRTNATQTLLDRCLWKACRDGETSALASLCARGARVNATNPRATSNYDFPFNFKGWSAIHFAASYGRPMCIRKLLWLGGHASAAVIGHGWTPLHYAAHDGHDEACEALLEGGANASARVEADGSTPMHLAAMNGYVNTVVVLHGMGADVRSRDFKGRTPATVAAQHGHEDVVKALRRMYESNGILVDLEQGSRYLAQAVTKYGPPDDNQLEKHPESTEPYQMSTLERTGSVGFSTGGDQYSGYASEVGRHRRRGWVRCDSVLSDNRQSGSVCDEALLTDLGDGELVHDIVKYDRFKPSPQRMWGRYMDGECLLPESADSRSDLQPSIILERPEKSGGGGRDGAAGVEEGSCDAQRQNWGTTGGGDALRGNSDRARGDDLETGDLLQSSFEAPCLDAIPGACKNIAVEDFWTQEFGALSD